jgi:hypothetical protein
MKKDSAPVSKYLSTLKITHSEHYVPLLNTKIIHGDYKSTPVDFIKQNKAKFLYLIKHYFMKVYGCAKVQLHAFVASILQSIFLIFSPIIGK